MRALTLSCLLLAATSAVAQEDEDRVGDVGDVADVDDSEAAAPPEAPAETETAPTPDKEPENEAEAEPATDDETVPDETVPDETVPDETVPDETDEADAEVTPEAAAPTPTETEAQPEAAAAPAVTDPATASAAADDERGRLQLHGCRDRFARGDLAGARVCYESSAGTEHQTVTRHVAGTLARVEGLRRERGPSTGERISGYVLGGKAELVATSGVYAAYLGIVGDFTAVGLMQSAGLSISSPELGVLLLGTGVLVPLATGGATLAGVGIATWLLEDMTAGQANLLRASMWLAAFDASVTPFITGFHIGVAAPNLFFEHGILLTTGTILGVNAAVMGSAVAAAALLPERFLPPSAGSLALSAATYGGALTLLGMAMNRFRMQDIDELTLFAVVPNVAFLSGLALAPFVPLTRYETWLMDGGAVVGTLLGAAIVIGAPAGNPVVGYGGVGAGLIIGAGAAVAVGKLVPLGLDLVPLPDLVAVAPMVLPPTARTPAALGVQVGVDIGRLLAR